MAETSDVHELAYGRSTGKRWRRLARRVAWATAIGVIAVPLGLLATWLFARSQVSVTPNNAGTVDLAWQMPPLSRFAFDGIRVTRTNAEGSTSTFDVPVTTGRFPTAWADTAAEPGMIYDYALVAYRIGVASTIPLGEEAITTSFPAFPSVRLSVKNVGFDDRSSFMMLEWQQSRSFVSMSANSESEPPVVRRLRVQRDAGDGWVDAYVGPTSGQYLVLDDAGCQPTDLYRVRRENIFTATGQSVVSDYSPTACIAPPAPPRNLSVRYDDPGDLNRLYIEWEHDDLSATGFAVQHRIAVNANWQNAARGEDWRAAATTYLSEYRDDVDYYKILQDGRVYDFRVRAEIRRGEPRQDVHGREGWRTFGSTDDSPAVASDWVTLASVRNPVLLPTDVNAIALPGDHAADSPFVRVEWEDHRTHDIGTGYRVDRRTADGDDWQAIARVAGGIESFDDHEVDPEAVYVYRVTATQADLSGDCYLATPVEDWNDVTVADHPYATGALEPPQVGGTPFSHWSVSRSVEMNEPHAYVSIAVSAAFSDLNYAALDFGVPSRIRATANGDPIVDVRLRQGDEHPMIDYAFGSTMRGERKRRDGVDYFTVSYPTTDDAVTVRIEAEILIAEAFRPLFDRAAARAAWLRATFLP